MSSDCSTDWVDEPEIVTTWDDFQCRLVTEFWEDAETGEPVVLVSGEYWTLTEVVELV